MRSLLPSAFNTGKIEYVQTPDLLASKSAAPLWGYQLE